MVEMRWVERPSPLQQPNSKLVYMERVLQYRNKLNTWGGEVWSEWIDVPTVSEP